MTLQINKSFSTESADAVEKLTTSSERTRLAEYLPSTATFCEQRLQFGAW
jgi:hypothetical protein